MNWTFLLLWLVLLSNAPAVESPPAASTAGTDQAQARAAVEAGTILPLDAILGGLEPRHAGRILEVELEREDGRYVYEIEILLADGRKRELEIDAATGEVLEVETERARRKP